MTANWKKLAPAGAVAIVLLFVPLIREEASAPFVIEPSERAVLRAETSGLIQSVFVREGDAVKAGERVAGMRSLAVDSAVVRAGSGLRTADARATEAQLRNTDYAALEPERRRWSRELSIASARRRELDLVSPIAGTVVTPHLDDLPSTWVDAGTAVAEVQNLSKVRARVFIAEPDMRVLTRVTGHSLRVFSAVEPVRGDLASLSPTPQIVEAGLIPLNKYKGLTPPPQFVAMVLLDNADGSLRTGMSGDAKIFGVRRSVAGMVWQVVSDFAGRKIW